VVRTPDYDNYIVEQNLSCMETSLNPMFSGMKVQVAACCRFLLAMVLMICPAAMNASESSSPLDNWFGIWQRGKMIKGNKNDLLLLMLLTPGSTSTSVRVSGTAYLYGDYGSVRSGQVNGEAVPAGDRLHVVDGSCVLDLILTGEERKRTLEVMDNAKCGGGMNVSFSGKYHNLAPQPRKKN